jgi:hypothetical protein
LKQTRLWTITLLAGSILLAGGTAHADECGAAVAKGMSTCIKKVANQHATCLKKTGTTCTRDAAFAVTDEKIVAAADSFEAALASDCGSVGVIAAGGFGTLGQPAPFRQSKRAECLEQGQNIAYRAFGRDNSRYSSASDTDKKCLLAAAKAGSKAVSKAIKSFGKCFEEGCTIDFSEDEAKAAASLAKKCANLESLTGQTPAEFVAASYDASFAPVKAMCDPLDTTRCSFPFPSDYFTTAGADSVTGRRVDLGTRTINTIPVPTRWNEVDGWSVGPMLLFQNSLIDLAQTGATPITNVATSLDAAAPVAIIDAETGAKQLLWVERDSRGDTVADQPIIIRVAKNLKENHRYIVALRNMRDSGGVLLPAPAAFALYKNDTPSGQLPVEARRPHMEEIFDILTDAGIATSDLYLAWDFTTQSSDSVSKRMLAMRDDAFGDLGLASPTFTVDLVTNNPETGILRYVDGTIEVPKYLVTNPLPGGNDQKLRTDINNLPYTTGDSYDVDYRCIIPESAATGGGVPAIPAKISLYGHGLLGSHLEVDGGNVRAMANEHNFVFCAVDWMGFAEDDIVQAGAVLSGFSNFPDFIDRQHQGMLNMMFLGRVMKHANGFSSHTAFQVGGQSMLDTSNLFYDGNSQGGILGGVLAAFEQDLTRMVLGVPGMNYSTLLNRSVDFDEFDETFKETYPLSTDRNLMLSLGQNIWDRTDPNGHINHVTSDNYAGTPAKTLLYHVAFGDHQVAPVTAEVAARSNGMQIHTPTLVPGKIVPEVTPYYGIPAIPSYPHSGSALVIWDSGNPAPPIGNVPPDDLDPVLNGLEACTNDTTGDPHSCPRSDPDARTQKAAFLDAAGVVIDVCGGAACEAQ